MKRSSHLLILGRKLWDGYSFRWVIYPLLLLAAINFSTFIYAQPAINRVEYYVDTDPGFDRATTVNIGISSDLSSLNIPLNPTSLNEGVHRLFVRAKSVNGWGLTNSWLFYKPYGGTGGGNPPPPGNISRVEYYTDVDPGFGKANPFSFTQGTNLSDLIIPVNPTILAEGVHRLYVRALNTGGWGLTNSWLFYKPYGGAGGGNPPPPGNISRIEYYTDVDPGFGKANPLAFTQGTNLADLIIPINPAEFTEGVHRLYVRALSASGWGLTNSWLFYKPYGGTGGGNPPPPGNISGIEYYTDVDPGFGKGNPLSFSPGTNLTDLIIPVNPTALAEGVHRLYIRALSASGWGLTNAWLFYKPYKGTGNSDTLQIPKLRRIEYYIDKDPGIGKGINVPFTKNSKINDLIVPVDISGLGIGNYTVYVRSQDDNNAWSLTNELNFKVDSISQRAFTIGKIGTNFCTGNSVLVPVKVNAAFGNGNTFTAQLSNSAGNFAAPINIGTLAATSTDTIKAIIPENAAAGSNYRIRVIASTPRDTTDYNDAPITIKRIPEQAFSISGNPYTCLGKQTYIINNKEQGVTYKWSFVGTGTLDTAKDEASITFSTAGSYTLNVTPSNTCGTGAKSSLQITVFGTTPSKAPQVTLAGRLLTATGGTINEVQGYQWYKNGVLIPGATNVQFNAIEDGNYTVKFTNACGYGPSSNAIIFSSVNINAVTPPAGKVGDVVMIKGSGFTAATAVLFNGTAAGSFSILSDSTITAIVPEGATSGPITISVPGRDAVSPDIFIIKAPPVCVNLIAPLNGASALSNTGTLNWISAEGSTGYKIYLGTGTDSSNLILVSTLQANSYNYSLSVNTKYFWKVVPYNAYGSATGCPIWSFTTEGRSPSCAKIISPSNKATKVPLNIILKWNKGAGSPTGYYVKIGSDSNNLSTYGTMDTTFGTNLEPGTTYYWQIVPFNANGNAAGCPLRSFSTLSCNPPTITAKGSRVLCKGQAITLTASNGLHYLWNTGDTAKSITTSKGGDYFAKVDVGSGCNKQSNTIIISNDITPVINSGGITAICQGDGLTISYSPVDSVIWNTGAISNTITVHPLSTVKYFVHGISLAGCDYRDSIKVTVNPSISPGAVSNMLPANNTNNLSLPVNLSWLPGSNNTKYDVYIWPDSALQPSVPFLTGIPDINTTISSGLKPGGKYKWRVVAYNGNCFSTPGPVQTFSLKNLPDLTPQKLQIPPTAFSEAAVNINWQVKNIASASTGSGQWTDAVFLSADSVFNVLDDLYVGGVANPVALNKNEVYKSSLGFKLPRGISGKYYVIVIADYYNNLEENNDSNNILLTLPLTVTLTPPPDLQVTSVVSPANTFSGNPITLSWNVQNNGTGATRNSSWKDGIYISSFPTFDPSLSFFLGSFNHNGQLSHDSTYKMSQKIEIPPYISGDFYLYVKTDVEDSIYESPFENNNIGKTLINVFLTPPPDLVITSLSAPPQATSGESLAVNYTEKNEGVSPTNLFYQEWWKIHSGQIFHSFYTYYTYGNYLSPWHSKLYISSSAFDFDHRSSYLIGTNKNMPDKTECNGIDSYCDCIEFFGGGNTIGEDCSFNFIPRLNADESWNTVVNATIPDSLPEGDYYLYLHSDGDSTLFESIYENNNVRRSDSVIHIYNPDLTVTGVANPPTANSGQNVSLTWKVNDVGRGEIFNHLRTDKIYLSKNSSFNLSSAILVDSATYTESIGAGSFVSKQKTITIPNGISGNYFIYIFTDARLNIFENTHENNNVNAPGSPITIKLSPYVDLAPDSIQIADTLLGGNFFSLSFRITNLGTANANGTSWYDNVYISSDSVWNSNTAKSLQSIKRSQSLNTGSSYSIKTTISLPVLNSLFAGREKGSFYFYVYTDTSNQVYEYKYENNNIRRSKPVYIHNPARPDLAVVEISASPSAISGPPKPHTTYCDETCLCVYYEVENLGASTTVWNNKAWYDGMFLSKDTVWDPADIFIVDFLRNGPLEKDSVYEPFEMFQVPQGIQGKYYLLMVADYLHQVSDANVNNNYLLIRDSVTGKPSPMIITLAPQPDLKIVSLNAPAKGISGQPLSVAWTIINNGNGTTDPPKWVEKFYLSTDRTLDGSDIEVGSFARTDSLHSKESYSGSTQINIPVDASGNYYLIMLADANHQLFEYQHEDNNSATRLITINQPPPSDLIVSDIDVPDSVLSGGGVFIKWDLKNIGKYPASGEMRDAVYISKDTAWDSGDKLLGTVSGNINLPPGQTIKRTLSTDINDVSIGFQHIIVRTDVLNNIYEVSDNNNTTSQSDSIKVIVKELFMNKITPDVLSNEKYLYYRINIPLALAGQTLLVTLKGDSVNGNNELYIRKGQVPSRIQYDFNFSIPFYGNQDVIVPSLQAGDYYIAVYGISKKSSFQNISLKASILPFAITSVNSNKGGNTGNATIDIRGSKFVPGIQIRLRSNTLGTLIATKVNYINPTKIFATFNLAGAKLGRYDVVARRPDNTETSMLNGFEVVTGSGGGFYIVTNPGSGGPGTLVGSGCDPGMGSTQKDELQTDVNYPFFTLANRLIPMTVLFGNSGNVDIPVPHRFIINDNDLPFGFTIADLDKDNKELYIEFREQNGPADLLRPGAVGAILIYTRSPLLGPDVSARLTFKIVE